jgi:LDH2 family malate/lactate/ureidoglycolate dehydrogenase
MPTQSPAQLTDLTRRIFEAAGASPANAEQVARSLVDANLVGHDSHGVIRIPQYISAIRNGEVVPAAEPSIVRETAATALIDGHWTFGQVSAAFATDIAVAKAKAEGVSMVGIVRVNHIGRLGEWATRAADEGIAAIVLASGFGGRGQSAVPFGGAKPLFGTNPLAVGIPAGAEADVLVDFATTAVAAGKIEVARAKKTPLPPGSIVDREGRPTTNPEDYYAGGALLPFGGHKGYALSVMVEFLGRIMTGADAFAEGPRGGPVYGRSGALIVALNPAFLSEPARYAATADETIHRLKAVPPAPASPGVLIPGEPEANARAEREQSGIPIPDETWGKITQIARELGVG